MSGARSVRIIRGDKRLKSRNLHTNTGGGAPCGAITLSDLTVQAFRDVAFSDSVSPSGGSAPYNLSVTIGSLPDGLSLNSATGAITGTPTTFGISNFTIGGADSNGCAVTPKSYIVEVWYMSSDVFLTPFQFSQFSSLLFNNISGLPSALGSGVAIDSVTMNASIPGYDLENTDGYFSDANDLQFIDWWGGGDIVGNGLLDTKMTPDSMVLLATGGPLYTGSFSDDQGDGGFSMFNGINPNDGLVVGMISIDNVDDGGFTSGTIIFKPI